LFEGFRGARDVLRRDEVFLRFVEEALFREEVEFREDRERFRSLALELLVEDFFEALGMAARCPYVVKDVQVHDVFVCCGYPLPDLFKPRVERALEGADDVDINFREATRR
jgi:hypothetical protein